MILLLHGEVCQELCEKLIKFYNELPGQDEAVIYFDSHGGNLQHEILIVDLINKYKSRTTLIGFGQLLSAAFRIFFSADCKKYLLPGTTGMCHFAQIQISINQELKHDYTEDKAKCKFMNKWVKPNLEEFLSKLSFTKKERDKILKGRDVYFQPDRMESFLQHNLTYYAKA